jgi:hypothetical protein
MSNVLLVDTNFSSGPIYQFLIQSCHNVTLVGGNLNDALAKSVDDYVQLDYSDVEKTRQLVADRKIDFLVPGCNDRSYMVCAEINQDGRFPGIDPLETAEIINNKEKFRAFAALHNLPTPRVLSEQEIGTRWPVIVKPVDAFSGRGVTIIREGNSHELPTALDEARQASRTRTCIVEEYVEGQLYSHTAFIQSGEIISDHIVEEHGTTNPFVVDTSRVSYEFPAATLENIRKDITLLASKLSLRDGLVHTQFIKERNQYWLIEITRRCPGDLYSQLIELSTGLNYAENYARPFVGLSFNIAEKKEKKWVMRHTLTQSHDYTFGSLSFNLPLMIKKWIQISLTGDRLRASPYGRIGIIFTEDENEQRLNETFLATLKRQLYTVAPK